MENMNTVSCESIDLHLINIFNLIKKIPPPPPIPSFFEEQYAKEYLFFSTDHPRIASHSRNETNYCDLCQFIEQQFDSKYFKEIFDIRTGKSLPACGIKILNSLEIFLYLNQENCRSM